MLTNLMKRIFDIMVAVFAILALSILLLWLYWRVRREFGSPVFFTQKRAGLWGKAFQMCKFRTMNNHFDENGIALPDEKRLTAFGRWLRASSLDELPELWNVLKGEMSLVGPRPLLIEYLPLYTLEQARRHDVKPGITGWAQVNGRNTISWEEKFKLDVWYVDHCSFLLDFKILLLTLQKVLKRDGISAANDATMPKFVGQAGKNT